MIKKYKDFSVNEAKATEDEEYDVRQILAELTQDMGFELELNKVYYSDNKTQWHENFDTLCQNPVLRIHLTKRNERLEESTIEKLLPSVHECVDRLSELGEAELMKFSLSRPYVTNNTLIDIFLTEIHNDITGLNIRRTNFFSYFNLFINLSACFAKIRY